MAAPSILVIKLGALGDFVQATGPFAAIRRFHAGARIVLLTTRPYEELALASGWFDAVWIDDRPPAFAIGRWLSLRKRLRGGRFSRVYDLQTSDRSSFYFHLLRPGRRPEWSGIAKGASLPHANPQRDAMHTLERQRDQLAMAGVADVPGPDLSWARADLGRFELPQRFVLVVPGGAPHRPAKRWPGDRFSALGERLSTSGLRSVIVGAGGEADLATAVAEGIPGSVNLTGRTSLMELAALARDAELAVGNDTGPMHMTAAAGCPSVVLFSAASDPALCAPWGDRVSVVRRDSLADLSVDAVAEECQRLLGL